MGAFRAGLWSHHTGQPQCDIGAAAVCVAASVIGEGRVAMAQVLLVDDDAADVARAEAALAAEGHTVVRVSGPDGCVETVRRVGPDVVVLEAVFGGVVAGFDLARSLAAQFPDLPLIMVSAADDVLDAPALAEQDVDGWLPVRRYLQKPVAGEVLVYEVEHALPTAH